MPDDPPYPFMVNDKEHRGHVSREEEKVLAGWEGWARYLAMSENWFLCPTHSSDLTGPAHRSFLTRLALLRLPFKVLKPLPQGIMFRHIPACVREGYANEGYLRR